MTNCVAKTAAAATVTKTSRFAAESPDGGQIGSSISGVVPRGRRYFLTSLTVPTSTVIRPQPHARTAPVLGDELDAGRKDWTPCP